MTSINQKRFCQICKSEKEGVYCPACKKETSSDLQVFIVEELKMRVGLKGQVREGEHGKVASHFEFSEKEVESGDPRFPDGVHISVAIDRRGDMYHQVVKDKKTGNIIHEEHEPLSQHRSKAKCIKKEMQG